MTDVFKTLTEVEARFGVSRIDRADFFPEWREALPTRSAVELERLTISTWSALPQALVYMLTNTQVDQSTVGLMTNGDDVLFVKLTYQPEKRYSLSRTFSLYTLPKELQMVLQILKRIGQAVSKELGRFKYRFFSILRGSSSHESTSFWYLIRRSDHSLPLILRRF